MTFTTLISIALGIGLAASSGFRVFLPLFALSLSAYFGMWPLNESWQWLASPAAITILGVATLAEAVHAATLQQLADATAAVAEKAKAASEALARSRQAEAKGCAEDLQ